MYEKILLTKIFLPLRFPKTLITQFLRNCVIFLGSPVDFLFTFKDPLDKISELKEVNHQAHNLGQKLLKDMKRHMSGGMQAYFVGSNFFKIIGIKNDMDFLVEYTTEDERKKWKKILNKYFGQPVADSYKFIKWETIYSGFPVEVLLSNPKFKIFRMLFLAYDAMRSDPEILADYEELKRNSVGVTVREYNRRQLFFFDFIVKLKLSRSNSRVSFLKRILTNSKITALTLFLCQNFQELTFL